MRARIVKIGLRYQPEIYKNEYGGHWCVYNTTTNSWEVSAAFPKRFWSRKAAQEMLDSLEGFLL